MKQILFIGCILIIVIGCWDIQNELPNGYKYIDKANSKSAKYIILEDSSSLKEQESNSIPCTIVKYKFNQNYILVKIKFHYNKNLNVGFNESKRLEEGKNYYYILDTKKHIRYGEYNEVTFNKEIKKLNMDF